jgi:hypothetical protein
MGKKAGLSWSLFSYFFSFFKSKTHTQVVPYYPYSKQSKQKRRGCVPAKLVAQLIKTSGVDSLVDPFLYPFPVSVRCHSYFYRPSFLSSFVSLCTGDGGSSSRADARVFRCSARKSQVLAAADRRAKVEAAFRR